MYLVEPSPETLPLAGKRCRVHEYADGRIEVRHLEQLLPCRIFYDKEPRVTQADIVSNKRLGVVLAKIQEDQRERDQALLAKPKRTLREKERVRAARSHADAPVARNASG